jgi:HAD superfamily hydrolase (TIGR01549 family)
VLATFLFDLDMTLVDSSALSTLRQLQMWKQVFKNIEQVRPFDCKSKTPPHEVPAHLKKNGHKVGIVTNSRKDYAEKIIDMFKIDTDLLVAHGDTDEHKPHPAPLELAIEKLKAKKKKTYYVGDDETDVEASYRAGITSIGAAWGPAGWQAIGAAPDIIAYGTHILFAEDQLYERAMIGEFMSPHVRWHKGSVLHNPNGDGFSLGRYFVASDPRHADSDLCTAIIDLKSTDTWAEDLGEVLGEAIIKSGALDTPAYLVAVPPKPKQVRIRYEQLIQEVRDYLDQYSRCYPAVDGLKCIKDYGDLKHLGYVERQLAVRGAFRSQYTWKNERVILLDDVSTTGATANECARVLYRDKAAEVIKISLGKDQRSFEAKTCPKCGNDLTIRTNSKTGEKFWGCKSYVKSKCTYTEKVN